MEVRRGEVVKVEEGGQDGASSNLICNGAGADELRGRISRANERRPLLARH